MLKSLKRWMIVPGAASMLILTPATVSAATAEPVQQVAKPTAATATNLSLDPFCKEVGYLPPGGGFDVGRTYCKERMSPSEILESIFRP